jgi:hypothetical protein
MMRRWWWKMAKAMVLRWVTGERVAVRKILMGAVLSVMTVFEGWTVYGLSFLRGGRGCIVKWLWCHKGVDG